MAMEIRINSAGLRKAMQKGPAALYRRSRVQIADVGLRYLGFHRARRMRGGEGVQATKEGLRKQFRVKLSGGRLADLKINIGTGSRVAIQHERGATIRTRSGTYLAVPFSHLSKAQIKRAKKLLSTTRHIERAASVGLVLMKGKGKRKRKLETNLQEVHTPDGRIFLAELLPNAPAANRFRFLFHLQKEVKLKPRLAFVATFQQFRPTAIRLINSGIKLALADIRGGSRAA